MNISDRNYQINTGTNLPQRGVDRPAEGGNVQGNLSANAQITQAQEGQVFRGQIVNITNNQVSISLDGSNILHARMLDALNLNIGDELTFLIKENNGSNVVIKPYADSVGAMKDSAIFKVLEQNNFSPSEKNYQIAESLMNHNMPVDKASMQRLMQQSYKFPDVSVNTLVAMNKLGIEVNQSTINQFEAYMANNHQMVNDLNQFAANITDFSMEVLNQMADGSMSDLGQLLDSTVLPNGGEFLAQNMTPEAEMLVFQETLLGNISDVEDSANVFFDKTDFVPQGEISQDVIGQGATGQETIGKAGVAESSFDMSELVSQLSDKLSENSEAIRNVFHSLMEMGVSKEALSKLSDGSETSLQLLNNINQMLKDNFSEIDPGQLKNFLASEGYRELLTGAVKKKFSLDGENMKQPGEVDDLYKSIYDKTNRLMQSFSSMGGDAGSKMNESAKNLQERIDFMQNLNQMYAYAQLPVHFAGNNLNSELFVYMNKKAMKEAKEEVSALLHLDMDHLGATDVHVSLRGSNVHTRFYVEDELSAKIIDEHMTMLEKAINESGYQLTNEVVTRQPSVQTSGNMVVDEMLGKDLEQSVKRYSFDVRM